MEALRDMHLPPGFGFHPSDAELISHYLKKKIHGQRIEYDLIPEVDIYKHEPWDLPSKCNLPIEDNKWHFFASRDRKYPTGARSNRATRAGYWKSTGKDRAIKLNKRTLGTKKTLVFHEGRPPSGKRTEWIMHEYYIDENECQASSDMKDAFVLCRVTRRDDWALENDNGVSNKNPHPQQRNDASTSVVIAEKQEDAVASDICAEGSNHIGKPASAENDVAPVDFTANSPDSESEVRAWMEELLAEISSDPAVDTSSASLSLVEQAVESSNSQNLGPMGPKIEPGHASPIQTGIDDTEYLTAEDVYSMFSGFDNAFVTNQEYTMMETVHLISPNDAEVTRNEEVQLDQGSDYANLSNENVDNGIIIRRRSVAASPPSSSESNQKIKLQVGVNRMITSKSGTINQTIKFTGNNGQMRSFKQSDATRSNGNLSNQGNFSGKKGVLRLSAGFLTCICMVGVIAAVLHGYYGINL